MAVGVAITELNHCFGIPEIASVVAGNGGLAKVPSLVPRQKAKCTCTARMSPRGNHVAPRK